MSFWLWDEQTGLDYLSSLPFVDSSKLGVSDRGHVLPGGSPCDGFPTRTLRLANLPRTHACQVAGCSGGGTQSSYLGAMDDRIAAASIACYTSTFKVWHLAAGALSALNDAQRTLSVPLFVLSRPLPHSLCPPPPLCLAARWTACMPRAEAPMASSTGRAVLAWAWTSPTSLRFVRQSRHRQAPTAELAAATPCNLCPRWLRVSNSLSFL